MAETLWRATEERLNVYWCTLFLRTTRRNQSISSLSPKKEQNNKYLVPCFFYSSSLNAPLKTKAQFFFQNTSTISFLFVFFTVRIEPSLPLSLLWASLLKRSVPASLLLPVKLYIRVARLQLKHENGKRAVWKSGECDIWLIQNPTLWLWLFPWQMQHVWDICFSGVGVVTNEITLAGQQQSPMIRQTVCFSPFRNGKKN